MADQNSNAQALAWYHTGAGSHEAAQADPDASLGNYRSSTLAKEIGFSDAGGISGITVNEVSGANGTGSGTLTASSTSGLKWTAPSGSQGSEVTIANGETKVIEDGGDPSKWIEVTRTSASDLSGSSTVTITDTKNNVFGMDNVTSAEASAGDDEYRGFALHNGSGGSVQNVKVSIRVLGTQRTSDGAQLSGSGAGTVTTTGSLADWPEQGYACIKTSGGTIREIVQYTSRTSTSLTVPANSRGMLGTSAAAGASDDTIDAVPGIRIAVESPSAQPNGYVQTIADEDTAPTGLTWSTPYTASSSAASDAISIGTMADDDFEVIWQHRDTPASASSDASALHHLQINFDA